MLMLAILVKFTRLACCFYELENGRIAVIQTVMKIFAKEGFVSLCFTIQQCYFHGSNHGFLRVKTSTNANIITQAPVYNL